MGKAADLPDFDKSLWLGDINISNGAFSVPFTCNCCEHISQVVYGWWNDGSPIGPRGERKLLGIVRRDRRATTADITTTCNNDDPNMILSTLCSVNCCVWAYVTGGWTISLHWQPVFVSYIWNGPKLSQLDIRRMEQSFLVRCITFSGLLHRRAYANTRIFKGNRSFRMHSWMETSRKRDYYGLANVFREHIKTHNSHTLPSLISVLCVNVVCSISGEIWRLSIG